MSRRSIELLPATVITAPITGFLGRGFGLPEMSGLSVQADFAYGSGGVNTKAWVQTSFDKGLTWFDIMNFAFLFTSAKKVSSVRTNTVVAAAYVPTDGTLADDTIKDGLLGDVIRVKVTTTGTYGGNTRLTVHAFAM